MKAAKVENGVNFLGSDAEMDKKLRDEINQL